ncbi:DUF2059 domain-containing protein [Qipengyuania sp. 1XM1-15A]|uniref:DUF2059 domain-containing protein n=1 Tax=Qipengyuania xiamenensis TaxID=2867237 RepID=UPI001C87EF44|nr:DUF2059 domain-containing protein [Qipengyuania xiamenensis]MBX7533855.1 DUF2059 domain-containing protein [Qipengyuania xiamenensis]
MKKWILALGAPLALSAQPVIAQEEEQSQEEVFATMAEMFKPEPLTAEQQANLPLAREVITMIMPEGAMAEMMGGTFDDMIKPMLELASKMDAPSLARELGVDMVAREMTDAEIEEASLLVDPVRQERNDRITEMMPELMTGMMQAMEPIMREAMIEVYAANFSTRELTDVATFFKTESGQSYARKSLALQQDPRLVGAVFKALPVMMGSLREMMLEMEKRMADLPAERTWSDLDAAERTRLQALTGLDAQTLEDGLAYAAKRREDSKKPLGDM